MSGMKKRRLILHNIGVERNDFNCLPASLWQKESTTNKPIDMERMARERNSAPIIATTVKKSRLFRQSIIRQLAYF
jgi:hypothetical protein